jgi:hypothetical protein
VRSFGIVSDLSRAVINRNTCFLLLLDTCLVGQLAIFGVTPWNSSVAEMSTNMPRWSECRMPHDNREIEKSVFTARETVDGH